MGPLIGKPGKPVLSFLFAYLAQLNEKPDKIHVASNNDKFISKAWSPVHSRGSEVE
jgi:hypothetical protein